jgi:hypothetical protein
VIRHYAEVSIRERLEWNNRIRAAFAKRGVSFEIDSETPEPSVCYMNYNGETEEFTFGCGEFWYDFTNIIPVIAMSHELGHYVDIMENFDGDVYDYDTLGINEIEVRAWLYAVDILKEIGFTRWEAFYRYASECLDSYFSAPFGFADLFRYRGDGTIEYGLQRLRDRIGMNSIKIEV